LKNTEIGLYTDIPNLYFSFFDSMVVQTRALWHDICSILKVAISLTRVTNVATNSLLEACNLDDLTQD